MRRQLSETEGAASTVLSDCPVVLLFDHCPDLLVVELLKHRLCHFRGPMHATLSWSCVLYHLIALCLIDLTPPTV
jgi:hypothetical protein